MEFQIEIRDESGVRYAPIAPKRGSDGLPLGESAATTPGLAWSGVQLLIVPCVEAQLEELPSAEAGPPPEALRALARLRAGVRVEGKRAPREAVVRWQERVVAGEFDADRCAEDLNQGAGPGEDDALLGRSGALLRDMLMSELTSGARGVARKARRATRGVVARLTAQILIVGVYSLLAFAALLLLRFRGAELDGFFDGILGFFGAGAGDPG